MMEFDEQHKWKEITWFEGYSPDFPSNLGMSEGNLVNGGPVGIMVNGFIDRLRVKATQIDHKRKGFWGSFVHGRIRMGWSW
jgi:hypothetical protein